VTITVPHKIKYRESDAFTDDEARTILQAALLVSNTDRAFAAAKRWVPWLGAYSGARVSEVTQLRGSDIQQRGTFHVMRLTPEAGSIKTRKPRTVPLHEHIVAQWFLEFVHGRGKGPLFYNPDNSGVLNDPMKPKRSRAVVAANRLAKWVREIGVKDEEVQPNHAWRDTFKQRAERYGISERVHDAITGHAAKSVGRTYGQATPEDMAQALQKFPRYNT
jgi:integrase